MNCRHRWEQVPCTYISPNRYWYICARCNASITTLLKEKT